MNALGRVRAIFLVIVLAALGPCAALAAGSDSPAYLKLTASDALSGRAINLGVDKSVVVDLPRPAGDVLVSNPQIADAVLRTSTRLYLIGVKLGQASVFLFDSSGNQIADFNVYVEADLSALNQLLVEAIPDGYVRAEALNGSIVLRGEVPSSADASRAVEVTSKMIAAQPTSVTSGSSTGNAAGTASSAIQSQTFNSSDGPGIINLLTISGEEQVALRVQVVEVQRSVVKQLGINAETLLTGSNFVFPVAGRRRGEPDQLPLYAGDRDQSRWIFLNLYRRHVQCRRDAPGARRDAHAAHHCRTDADRCLR